LLRVSPGSFYDSLLKYGDFYNRTTLQEYIDDPVSNFVVQTLLSTVQTKDQAEALLKALSPIIASGSVIDPAKKRRGILWKTVELAANHRVGQDGILKSIRLGIAALQDVAPAAKELDETSKQKKKQRRKASAIDLAGCIHELLDAKIEEGENARLVVDVSGARTVHFLLRFAPRLCEDTIEGIVSYPSDMLIKFAQDGLASCCIWDGLLDGPTESPSFSKGLQKLRKALSGQWVALSCDRVGQHVVKKMFKVSPNEERMKIAEELSHAIPRLSGCAMGRNVMDVCAVREFSQGVEAWNRAVRKAGMQADFLSDVIGGDNKKSKRDKASQNQDNSEETRPPKKHKNES